MNIFTTLLIQPLTNGLILFYKVLGENLGLAIIGFTFFLRFALNPLTKPYMESMKKIKDYAPQVEKLKEKHKGDKLKLAKAQADFYREKNINPQAGCLPYILQIIVLIAFFNVFTKVLNPVGDGISSLNELLYAPLKFGAGDELKTTFLYLDLKKPDTFMLPSVPFALPGPILLAAAIVQFLSAKISLPHIKKEEKIVKKTESQSDDMQVAMQKSMIYTFPMITIFFGTKFPSGLAIYWFLFSLMQAFQQYKSQGWGGLTPWIKKLGLIKSARE